MLAETHRFETLAAMGVDVYLLRTREIAAPRRSEHAVAAAPEVPVADASATAPALIVACAHGMGADSQAAHLRLLLPLALGIASSRIAWIELTGALAPPPAAVAYLALGTDSARALGEQLSTMQQNSAVIAVADAPRACLGNGLARRALWQTLKPIARRLHRSAD